MTMSGDARSAAVATVAARILDLDHGEEVRRVTGWMVENLRDRLHRRGFVVAMSGGIDSSVCAALAVEAVGAKRVLGLLLPERDSSPESVTRGQALATHLGIETIREDITGALEAVGCYRWRDAAMSRACPRYSAGWKSKIVIAGGLEGRINHFRLIVESPDGAETHETTLRLNDYLEIVAATNFKQRIRKMLEYFHADRLNYAVVGTPNRLEYDQGFFVKNGDGSADLKPIAHLYKTQVYALARWMELPDEICGAKPTTDTYSLPQGQDEFYYGRNHAEMDLALWHYDRGAPPQALAEALEITPTEAARVYEDIERKRRTTAPLHLSGLVMDAAARNR